MPSVPDRTKAAKKEPTAPQPAPITQLAGLSSLAEAQPQVVAHLTQALAGGRQAHAFFLVGGRASQARTLGWALVAALVCQGRAGRDACLRCASCRRWHAGHHPNVHVLLGERPGHIGIDKVRALRHKLTLMGHDGAPSVVVVDKAAELALPAQQALLKILEEPPGATTFVLVAEHVAALLPTLRSRMSVLQVKGGLEQVARAQLANGGVSPLLADFAAPYVGGDVAAAEALVDAGLGQVTARLEDALRAGDDVMLLARAAQELGQDETSFRLAVGGLAMHVRDALLGRLVPQPSAATPQRSRKSLGLIGHVASNQLCAAADALCALMAARVSNLNRPLALEGLFLLLNQSSAT